MKTSKAKQILIHSVLASAAMGYLTDSPRPALGIPEPKPKAVINALVVAAKAKRLRKNMKRLRDHRKSIQNNPCLA